MWDDYPNDNCSFCKRPWAAFLTNWFLLSGNCCVTATRAMWCDDRILYQCSGKTGRGTPRCWGFQERVPTVVWVDACLSGTQSHQTLQHRGTKTPMPSYRNTAARNNWGTSRCPGQRSGSRGRKISEKHRILEGGPGKETQVMEFHRKIGLCRQVDQEAPRMSCWFCRHEISQHADEQMSMWGWWWEQSLWWMC